MTFNRRYIEDDVQTTAQAGLISDIGNYINNGITNITDIPSIVPQSVDGNHSASSKPIIILNVWLTSGYDLQPANQYATINQQKTLYASSGRSFWEALLQPLATPHYSWYQSTDNKKWTLMSSNEQSLTVVPDKVGTVYYKQATDWYWPVPLLTDTIVYSKTAFVTTFPNAVDATKLDVVADSTYLYNNQPDADTVFVKGNPTPSTATGNITWSVDDSKLATVNKYTGLVVANNLGNSGTVKVTGQMTNNDGSIVRGSLNIRIGGGLDDQRVKEGDPANFEIQGQFDQKPTSVVWHEVLSNGQDKVVDKSGNNMSYTIPKTTYLDDGSQFYAVMTIQAGNKNKIVTTNKAVLKVDINYNPEITFTNTVFNNSRDNHNEDNTVINNVSEGDKLTYKINVSDANVNSKMKSAIIGVHWPKTVDVTEVKLDGINTANVGLITDPENQQGTILIIHGMNFTNEKTHSLEVNGTIGKVDILPFVSTVSLLGLDGTDATGNEVVQMTGEPSLLLNSANSLISLVAHDWQYQTINMTGKGKLLHRLRMPENDLDVYDDRINKESTKLYLLQKEPLKSGDNILPSEIRYYHKEGNYDILDDKGALVEETAKGETLKSVAWSNDEGPLLYIKDGKAVSGVYSTKLEWSLVESL